MHIHIVGICGTFMGGLAALARASGHQVTGCDANVYPPMSTQLEALGIRIVEGFAADQVALRPDLFVIGNVAKRGMPLIEAILDQRLPYTSGPQWLGEQVLAKKWVLAVAGTHGKTTTSSMLAWILEAAGKQPGFLIGGVPLNFGETARLGGSELFVIEADEYDTAFFDKRSKFVHYRPKTAILNNLEYDHADIFADLAAIETQFHHLVRTVPSAGRVICNADEAALDRVLTRGCWTPVERFGSDHQAAWRATDMRAESFTVLHQGKPAGEVRWTAGGQVQGAHNRANALAAIAAAHHAGVPVAEAAAALGRFENVKRRMEKRGEVRGVTVFDDFAHHPTAIATTVEGLRTAVGTARILAVLEPRSNTMKLGTMKAALPASLKDADLVFGYGEGLGWDLAEALAPMGDKARVFAGAQALEALVAAIVKAARPGDQVLVMSNGGFGGVHEKLLRALSEAAAAQ